MSVADFFAGYIKEANEEFFGGLDTDLDKFSEDVYDDIKVTATAFWRDLNLDALVVRDDLGLDDHEALGRYLWRDQNQLGDGFRAKAASSGGDRRRVLQDLASEAESMASMILYLGPDGQIYSNFYPAPGTTPPTSRGDTVAEKRKRLSEKLRAAARTRYSKENPPKPKKRRRLLEID